MQPFVVHAGTVAVIDRANIDTDAIIPKQYLRSIHRTGFGSTLFSDWRYRHDGTENPEFILNQPGYRDASVLVAQNNFGCGSSREHAVWAIGQFGFRAVIAPWKDGPHGRIPAFADIFRNNALKNGLLTIELSAADVQDIIARAQKQRLTATIDLPAQTVTLNTPEKKSYRFEIDAGIKHNLVKGLDDIALTLESVDEITAFEKKHETFLGRND